MGARIPGHSVFVDLNLESAGEPRRDVEDERIEGAESERQSPVDDRHDADRASTDEHCGAFSIALIQHRCAHDDEEKGIDQANKEAYRHSDNARNFRGGEDTDVLDREVFHAESIAKVASPFMRCCSGAGLRKPTGLRRRHCTSYPFSAKHVRVEPARERLRKAQRLARIIA